VSAATRIKAVHEWLVPPASGQGWTAYLWLFYFAFFYIEWFFRPVGAVELALGILTTLAFLVVYFSSYRRRGGAALAHIAALVVMGSAWSAFNSGASVLFIYAAAFANQVGPPRRAAAVVIGIAVLAALISPLADPSLFYWLPGVLVSLIVGFANIFFAEQERRNAELRLKQSEVKRLARVAERERIARDLHDVLGHTLSMIAVKSELAERLVDQDPVKARGEIRSMGETARQTLAEVREAISGYRQQNLDEALEHARLSLQSADVALELDVDDDIDLPTRTQAMLGLVIREAATNIIRHSDARHCRLALQRDADGIRLSIADDGGGRIRMDGSGIQGIRARIESLGGRLSVGDRGPSSLTARIPGSAA
jgi:two-component system sensor histidine kinase DesK